MSATKIANVARLADWLSAIVRIPSVTPTQAGPRAGVPGEAHLAGRVAEWFSKFGGEVISQKVSRGRPNIYGIWRGESARWLAIDVHTDTVGVEQMIGDPFDGRIEDGRVYGRGAVDTKATLGVVLAMLEEMHTAGRRPAHNLLIAATADEEGTARGAPVLADWLGQRRMRIDELLVAEPTMCAPVHGHRGAVSIDFSVKGKSVHASQAHLGQNAVSAAVRLALAMEEEHGRLQSAPPSPVGLPSLHVTRISGGLGANIIPDACCLTINRRIVSIEKAAEVSQQLQKLAAAACPLATTSRVLHEVEAFYQPPDAPLLRKLAEWSGAAPTVAPYGTNAWAYKKVTEECVVIGPGSINQAHGDVEWVEIAQLDKFASILSRWWTSR